MEDIKLILFDFDKTLTKGPKEGYIPKLTLKNRFNFTEDQINVLSKADKLLKPMYFDAKVSQHINTRKKEEKLHYSLYLEILKDMDIDNYVEVTNYLVEYRMDLLRHELSDSAIKLLETLKKKYKLAIFSNALPSREKEIKDIGLNKYFDAIYISNLLGSYKPQKEFFDYPAREFGVGYSEMLLIDDKEHLVQQVNNLGIKAIMVDQTRSLKEQLEEVLKLNY